MIVAARVADHLSPIPGPEDPLLSSSSSPTGKDSRFRRSDSMASGTSGRPSGGSKGFDFAADDVLCSYDDFNGHDSDPKRPPEASTRGTSKVFPFFR